MLPREKLLLGLNHELSIDELIAIIIGNGSKNSNVFQISKIIANNYFYKNQLSATIDDLIKIKGVGHAKALRIFACLELIKRQKIKMQINKVVTAGDAYQMLLNELKDHTKEHAFVINLDVNKSVISIKNIATGILDGVQIHPREVFKSAISQNAHSIILAHNHPSGSLIPSQSDIFATKDIYKASKLIGIKLIDHIIFCDNDFLSVFDYIN